MPDKYYRLNVNLLVQPTVANGVTFFSGSGSGGFPGVIIGAGLAGVVDRMNGAVLLLPDPTSGSSAADEARNRILLHFEGVTGVEGPPGSRWVPVLATVSWTIEGKIRWQPGFETLAFQLGTEALTDFGTLNPANPENSFEDIYSTGPGSAQTSAKLWLSIFLEAM